MRKRAMVLGLLIGVNGFSAAAQQQSAGVISRPASIPSRSAPQVHQLVTVRGSALTAINEKLANKRVRLRDARFGRIVDTQATDRAGGFVFKAVEPGNYIVELVSGNQTTVAASQLLSTNAGETVNVIVKMPFKPSLIATILGEQSSASASPAGTGGLTELASSAVEQLPQAALQSLQSIPAVVQVGDPVSPR